VFHVAATLSALEEFKGKFNLAKEIKKQWR
jgi:hypothetical protein